MCVYVCVGGGGLEGFWLPGPGEYLKIWQITVVFHKYSVFMQHIMTWRNVLMIEECFEKHQSEI